MFANRLRSLLTYRHMPLLMAALAMLLTLPSLGQGWVADDLIHRLSLKRDPLPDLLKNLFIFAQPGQNTGLIEAGLMPWWTLPELKVAFFRPLSVLTHWLDYQLWPDQAWLMHVQNILWYGGLCLLCSLVYRRFFPLPWLAGLASLLFTLDLVHLGAVSWLANRNALLASCLVFLALLKHDQWQEQGVCFPLTGARSGFFSKGRGRARRAAWSAWLYFGLALLAGETGLGLGAYLVAYVLCLQMPGALKAKTWFNRLKPWLSLLPYGLIALLWRIGYQLSGYGLFGSDFYLDPGQTPFRFALAVLERGPILLLSQGLGVVPIFYNFLAPSWRIGVWIVTCLALGGFVYLLWPLLRQDALARFFLIGMLLALIPACAVRLLSGRVLLLVSFGAMGLLAQFLAFYLKPGSLKPGSLKPRSEKDDISFGQRTSRGIAYTLGGLHLIIPLVLVPISVTVPGTFQNTINGLIDLGESDYNQRVVILNAPSPFHFIYHAGYSDWQGKPVPEPVQVLAPAYTQLQVSRPDAQTLQLRPEGGFFIPLEQLQAANQTLPPVHAVYMYHDLARFFRAESQPLPTSDTLIWGGTRFRVLETTADDRPSLLQVRFEQSLAETGFRYLYWDWVTESYQPFSLPAIGETIIIPGL